jgi:adenylylsulfate kinase-like enzyme
MNKSPIIWLTGMSGSGKSTLANHLKNKLKKKVLIIDGDSIRDLDQKKLGFGLGDVLVNNMRIASLCEEQRSKFDLVLVPVISPYEKVRQKVRETLEPNFHLIYLKADIYSLKSRDTKGLYAAADRGEIKDLIGYSNINPYDNPVNPELTVLTSSDNSVDSALTYILKYLDSVISDRHL